MPSIDVVIPSYNYGRYLPQCIRSVLDQQVESTRVIVIDNASTDDSVEIARRMAREDGRVEVVARDVNLGHHASFNEGIDRARADYFVILCADDLLAPGTLARTVEFMEVRPDVVVAIGPEINMQEHARLKSSPRMPNWTISGGERFIEYCCQTMGNGLGLGAMVARTAAQQAAGSYTLSLPYTDDLEMLLRLARHGSVARCSVPIGIRREHDTNMSGAFLHKRLYDLEERKAAFENFFQHHAAGLAGSARMRAIAGNRLAEAAYWSAASSLLRGHRADARELYGYGLKHKPSLMLVPPLGHLLRKRGAFKRAAAVLGEAMSPQKRSPG